SAASRMIALKPAVGGVSGSAVRLSSVTPSASNARRKKVFSSPDTMPMKRPNRTLASNVSALASVAPVEISHSNPDVIDPLDCDVLGHRDLRASVVGWARCSSRHDTIAECERHESKQNSIDQHVALRAPNMPMHQVVV